MSTNGQHWYTEDGEPMYEIPTVDGKGVKSPDIRDARKMRLKPGVTDVLKMAAKPGLEQWKLRQVLEASMTLPAIEGEEVDKYAKRVMLDAVEYQKEAARIGSLVHNDIAQIFTEGISHPGWPPVAPVALSAAKLIKATYGADDWRVEHSFASPLGYGGRADLWKPGVVVDFKGVQEIAKAPRKPYPEQGMQLAAYAEGVVPGGFEDTNVPGWFDETDQTPPMVPPARLVNLYFSRTEDKVDLREWSPEDAECSWEMFKCLLEYWQLSKDYDSSFEGES